MFCRARQAQGHQNCGAPEIQWTWPLAEWWLLQRLKLGALEQSRVLVSTGVSMSNVAAVRIRSATSGAVPSGV